VRLITCDDAGELLPAYVLEALDAEERQALEAHLAACAPCREELRALQQVAAALALAVSWQQPPAHLEERVRVAAAQEAGLSPLPGSLTDLAPLPTSAPRWAVSATRARRTLLRGAAGAVAAALVLGAVGATGWWGWQQHVSNRQLRAALARYQQALSRVGQGQVVVYELQPDPGAEGARGHILVNPSETVAVLMVNNLPPLPAHMVYQVWLIRDGQRESGGFLYVSESGAGMAVVSAPQPLSSYQAVGITPEPKGGSPGPTAPRVMGTRLT